MAQQPQYGEQPQGQYGEKQGISQQPMQGQQPAQAYEHASKLPSKFQFGVFDCFAPLSTCCLGCWCPCILFGKTHARERGEQDPSGFNGMCLAHCCLAYCYAQGVLQCINRGNMQDKYGMDNNAATNFLLSCCCGPCSLIQEEKESLIRKTGIDPKTQQPYVPPTGMSYP